MLSLSYQIKDKPILKNNHFKKTNNMKKIILFAVILFAGVSVANAAPPTPTDDVTLNVKLYGIQSLIVNTGQKIVDLNYLTIDDYADGVSSTQADHLKIFSNSPFTVSVKSGGELVGTDGSILASTIKITAEDGTTKPLTTATYSPVTLATTDATLITSPRGKNNNFNITYSGLGDDAYVDNYKPGEDPTVYTATVTYTLAAQ